MKVFVGAVSLGMIFAALVTAQEIGASVPATTEAQLEVPKQYEVGDDTISPDGRCAILYPIRDEAAEQDDAKYPPNLLVRLKPYAVLAKIDSRDGGLWKGARGAPKALWNGNAIVAVWHAKKWGNEDLVVYQIEGDKVTQVERIWPEVVRYFDRDWRTRFLKKYPKEAGGHYTIVSDDPDRKDIQFKGDKLLLDIRAENKPNLAP